MTIVTTHYRYKRPPRKRKAVAIEAPVIVRAADPGKGRRPAQLATAKDRGINDYWLFCAGAIFQPSNVIWTDTGSVENGGMRCEMTPLK